MLKVLLYGAATFLETGIGVWTFGKIFPRRASRGKKICITVWVLWASIAYFIYTLLKFYLGQEGENGYPLIPGAAGICCAIILALSIAGILQKNGENMPLLEIVTFAGMVGCLTCQYWNSYYSDVTTLLGNIFPVLFIYGFYKCTIIEAYLWGFFYFANIGFFKTIFMVYASAFENRYFSDFFHWPRQHTYCEVVYLLVIYLLLLTLMKCIPVSRITGEFLGNHKTVIFLTAATEWAVAEILVNSGTGKATEREMAGALIIFAGLMLCLLVLIVRFFKKTLDTEKKLLDVRNETMESQYKELNESYERYRCLVHDEKHMVSYVKECLNRNEVNAALRFLDSYQAEVSAQGRCTWTGIVSLDFMLNIKKRKMDAQNIRFFLDCRIEQIPMDDADFIVAVGNLLDNAIEAAEQCKSEERSISLSIRNVNEMFLLRLHNTSTAKPNIKKNRFLTGKREKDIHGWGIESVKRIVEKYAGEITFQYDTTYFEVSIMIINE